MPLAVHKHEIARGGVSGTACATGQHSVTCVTRTQRVAITELMHCNVAAITKYNRILYSCRHQRQCVSVVCSISKVSNGCNRTDSSESPSKHTQHMAVSASRGTTSASVVFLNTTNTQQQPIPSSSSDADDVAAESYSYSNALMVLADLLALAVALALALARALALADASAALSVGDTAGDAAGDQTTTTKTT